MKDMKDKDKIQWNKSRKMFRIQASEAIVTGNISNFILFHFIFVRPPDSVRKPVTRWTRLTRWLGEFPTKHSVRKIITRWEDPWLGGRQWTRWTAVDSVTRWVSDKRLGEKNNTSIANSVRKSATWWTRWTWWEYANTRSLFNKLGEICRVLGTRSDLWNWLSKFSVLAESLCQGVIRFQKKNNGKNAQSSPPLLYSRILTPDWIQNNTILR